jgi:hypothetical protein
MNLTQVVTELRDEQLNAANHAQQLGTVITALETLFGGTRSPIRMTRTPVLTGRTPGNGMPNAGTPHKRTLSVKGRKAIATAQKARWALIRGKKAA